MTPRAAFALAALLLAAPAAAQSPVTRSHGLAMHGDLRYGPDFRHFDYANPDAPKGGDVKFAAIGTFDSLNPFIIRGVPAGAVGQTLDTLMVNAGDEPFSEYCLICETVEMPADRSWIVFHLRPQARFHDGSPITPEDVIWTLETLRAKGNPFFRAYYGDVAKAEKVGERAVKFTVGSPNRELPLILGQLVVLSRKWWEGREFDRPSLDAPLGSGPYRIESLEAGRYVQLRRVPDYWAKDLPVRRGMFNFDGIRTEWYRDSTIALEAFKGGEYDIRAENIALNWATRYQGPALERGWIVRVELPMRTVSGMQGFVMNMRRPVFADPRVREAMGYGFDFEWSNRTLFHDSYVRTRSYFDNSELAATGLPDAAQLALLDPLRAQLPARVFTEAYAPPKTDGSGNMRDSLRVAARLLREAGWTVKDGKLVDAGGRQMKFEFLMSQGGQLERIVNPYLENLKRLGIDAQARVVDAAQYKRRLDDFDFDMILGGWGQSESPGNEQREYWSSAQADLKGSQNHAGLKNPAVDRLVETLIAAPDRAALVTATRALDRALQWSFLVVPNWHSRVQRVAYWDRFGRPEVLPKVPYQPSLWWVDPEKDAALARRRAQAR